MDKLVDAINNLIINDVRYELSTATASDRRGDLTSNPDTVTHTRNIILDQKLLSCRTIVEFSVLSNPTNPTIRLVPHTLLMPALKEIFADTMSGNAWTNSTPCQISRTRVDRSYQFTLQFVGNKIFD